MKLPAWDEKHVRWDKYEAFHMAINNAGLLCQTGTWLTNVFTVFDDGQVLCMLSSLNPDQRHKYAELDVTLVATGDKDCPTLCTPDGEVVKKAWLNDNGMQHLLIDHASGRAVRLGSYALNERQKIVTGGKEVVGTAAFDGDGALPQGAPIALRRPFKTLTAEQQKQLDDFICSTRAAMQLLDHPSSKLITHNYPAMTHTSTLTGRPHTVAARTWTEQAPQWKLSIERVLEVKSWEELDDAELKRLYFAGVADRPRQLVDYLIVKGD